MEVHNGKEKAPKVELGNVEGNWVPLLPLVAKLREERSTTIEVVIHFKGTGEKIVREFVVDGSQTRFEIIIDPKTE